jgi:hypothetical protein
MCPNDKPYLSSDLKCISCNVNEEWNSELRMCWNGTCINEQFYNATSKRCECPADKPHLSSNLRCLACDSWNERNRTCITCLNGQVYNKLSEQCECPA